MGEPTRKPRVSKKLDDYLKEVSKAWGMSVLATSKRLPDAIKELGVQPETVIVNPKRRKVHHGLVIPTLHKKKEIKSFRRMNKRGGANDALSIAMYFFIFAIITLVSYALYDKADSAGVYDDNQYTQDMGAKVESSMNILDNSAPFIIAVLGLVGIGSAFLIRAHPAWAIVTFITLALAVLMAAQLSTVYESASETPSLNATALKMNNTGFVMDNLPLFVLVIGIIIIIVLYGVVKSYGVL